MLLAENWSFFKLNYVVFFSHMRNVDAVSEKKSPRTRPTTNVEQIEIFSLWNQKIKIDLLKTEIFSHWQHHLHLSLLQLLIKWPIHWQNA